LCFAAADFGGHLLCVAATDFGGQILCFAAADFGSRLLCFTAADFGGRLLCFAAAAVQCSSRLVDQIDDNHQFDRLDQINQSTRLTLIVSLLL
jgi:hypothetical protein